mgnify:FL=1|tara:strand:- start:3144 stop:3896 length:753 start_codon:yes stop_codon:yes gene_type:complete
MAVISTRQGLIDYCLRRLGDPVIEINVDVDQIEDKVDDSLQKYQEFHSDATLRAYLKHQVTQTDIDNKYIPIPSDVVFVTRVFPVTSTFGSSGMFDIRYQMMLNSMADFITFAGDMSYFYQMQQYLSMVDQQLHGMPLVQWSRHQDKLYIFGDFNDGDLKIGDYVVAEIYSIVDPETYTSIYNDMFMKDFTTQLIKQQWGANMSKFDNMQLPGGVTVNGTQMYQEATEEIIRLEEKMRSEQEFPPDFFVG